MNENSTTPGKHLPTSWLVCLVVVLLGFLAFRMYRAGEQTERNSTATENLTLSAEPKGKTISVEIDFSNGTRFEFLKLPWREQVTLADVMKELANRHPGVDSTRDGEGKMAFLAAIGGIRSEGADGRNWLFYLNGKKSELGYGAVELEPDDQVLWKFEQSE